MTETTKKARRPLSVRRLALLATVGAVGTGVLFAAPGFAPQSGGPVLASPAYAQNMQRPAGFADIVEKVKPAVMSVRVKMSDPSPRMGATSDDPFGPGSPFEFFFRRFGQGDDMPGRTPRHHRRRHFTTGQGSGFFISADGYAVTNNHVVDKAETVQVTTDDGQSYDAKVIGTDPRTDLALIKVDGKGRTFPTVALADKAPRIGDWVLAVGNPFGLGGTVTAGIVSARGRDIGSGPYDDFIQIDAPVNRGNSGGPSFDVDGNVIGVNTAIFSPSGGSVGIAFAIPAETVRNVVDQLKDKGQVTRGWIGVQIQPVSDDIADSLGLKKAEGALVAEPQDGSPADKAGIKSGDVIMSVNGDPVKDARSLARTISAMPPGTSVKLGLYRNGKTEDVTLTLGELPKQRTARADRDDGDRGRGGRQDTEVSRLGLTLAPADNVAGAGGEGVVVTEVDPDGAAADRVRTGDVILDVAGTAVSTPRDVRRALADATDGGKKTVLMRIKSGQNTRFVAVPLGKG
ncbi:Serine protease precursor protein [Rhodovulum sp. PH10]|uniref:Do family serine endopeptidase n=1 Tax=Rhodovulum sp. PH10 TaxID=1187851 RepID=UPI00027C281F|nr:Do family serine endopeptidase [Rhodovulum sp. PH10]EJW10184.1 Serine protease precursor protein [Rhodovulum sp. PH10]